MNERQRYFTPLPLRTSILQRQQTRIAACGRGVDGEGAFDREAQQIMRTAGLGAGAGQVLAAEWLHADHRADLIAVDVEVANLRAAADVFDGFVDAAVDAECQAKTRGVDRSEEHTSELQS